MGPPGNSHGWDGHSFWLGSLSFEELLLNIARFCASWNEFTIISCNKYACSLEFLILIANAVSKLINGCIKIIFWDPQCTLSYEGS